MDEKLDLRIKINGGLFEFGKLEHPTVNSFFLTIQDKFSNNQTFVRSFYDKHPASFNIFLTNSMADRASANTYLDANGNNVDYIIFCAGLPFTLLNIFLRILALPSTFIDVGHHTKEVLNKNCSIKIDEILENPENINIFPKCKIRELYALELAKSALDFIFCHELAHLYRGHCDYINNNKNKLFIPHPLKDLTSAENATLDLQALEFDADLIGMKISWFLMSSIGKLYPQLKEKNLSSDQYSALTAVYKSPIHAFRALIISSYTYFRIYAKVWNPKTQFIDAKLQQVEHPDSSIRMLYILYQFIESQEPIVEHEDISVQWKQASPFQKNLTIILEEAEKSFALMQDENIDLRPFHSIALLHEEQSIKYLEMLFGKRAELIPALEPYMRGKGFSN